MKGKKPAAFDPAILKQIPQVDKVLHDNRLRAYENLIRREYLTVVIQEQIAAFREKLKKGLAVDPDHLYQDIIRELDELLNPYHRSAVNALGIVLHTGLGRAPFGLGVAESVAAVSRGYSRLQIDDEGRRGDRYQKIARLLRLLTGAEDAVIVNNNAGATLLILHALCAGREVIVSRGQLVEIGGSFRIPDVMAQSGAIMREVGTTNRTHLKDYETAINPATGALLRVHQSNYRITGFTKEVPLADLVALARKNNLTVIDDLGSGALLDLERFGLPREPVVPESIRIGADIVCFSGDKLIGGPQCGIILGRQNLIEKIKKDPLHRALRCDKLTNAALEATLRLFLKNERDLINEHAVLRLLMRKPEDIKRAARRCARALQQEFGDQIEVKVKTSVSEIGGGSLSTEELPTYVVSVLPRAGGVDHLARRLRQAEIPVYGRVIENELRLDFRTVLPGQEKNVLNAFRHVFQVRRGS